MKGYSQRFLTLAALAVGMTCSAIAQTGSSKPDPPKSGQPNLTARVDPPPPPTTAGTAGNTPASAPKSEIQPEVAAQLLALQTRIEQLENEVRLARAAQPDSNDAATLDAARKELTASMATPARPTPVGGNLALAQSETPATPPPPDTLTPFADGDWTWLNGNPRTKDCPLCSKYFTPEIRVDSNYNLDFNHPADDTISGSSEVFRAQEVQVEQLGVGGDLMIDHVHARLMTQFGMYSVTTPRNDGSVGRGQWALDDAYRYLAEAYGGYHWDGPNGHGINLDAGIFMSYIGLFSYYNLDNWAYQPSFVSSNTPWFFNGVRGQFFLTQHLKLEPWFINGWQSYARYNTKPGMGGQIKYTPTTNINIISNNYGYGEDDAGIHGRTRFHTDNSFEYRYYNRPDAPIVSKMAFSITADAGCEDGAGAACFGADGHKIFIPGTPTSNPVFYQKQSFLGWMAYNRFWFNKDKYGLTFGGGYVNNPGRYLVLLPPINGATAVTGSAYFPEDPGQNFHGEDGTVTWDYMPKQYITFRTEYGYRHSDVPYWAGRGGSTPPGGATNLSIGSPGDFTCTNGTTSIDSGIGYTQNQLLNYKQDYAANIAAATAVCAANPAYPTLWRPDLRRDQQIVTFAILVKF
jgi:hypothetical protein